MILRGTDAGNLPALSEAIQNQPITIEDKPTAIKKR